MDDVLYGENMLAPDEIEESELESEDFLDDGFDIDDAESPENLDFY